MACEVDIGYFPEDLGCLIVEDYVGTIFRKTKYLNNEKAFTKKPIVDAVLLITEKFHEAEFLEWWRDDLKNGTLPFLIEMKFFGMMHLMEFNFISNINEVLQDGHSSNPIKLELLNFQDVLQRPKYLYELICDTSILCDDELICT